jgi:hypothetical protein
MTNAKRTADQKVKEKHTPNKPTSKKASKRERKNTQARKMTAIIRNRPMSERSPGQEEAEVFPQETARAHSGELSGDLQGLPDIEHLDSENLHELLEEGNAFEANVLAGVQDAEDNEGKEIHTHEVPEDDVPGEYVDQE